MLKRKYFELHSLNFERLKKITSTSDPLSSDLIPLIRDYEAAIDFYNDSLNESFDQEVIKYLKLSYLAVVQLGRLVQVDSDLDFSTRVIRLRSFEGGLANRLRALCSAIAIADIFSSTLEISWLPDDHCDMNFETMFPSCFVGIADKKSPSNYLSSLLISNEHCIEIVGNPSAWILWDKYCKNKIDWSGFYSLYKNILTDVFSKHLKQNILSTANNLLSQNVMNDVIGLHIRSTDFLRHYELTYPGRRLAKVDDFISALFNMQADKVFLATDSIDIEREFAKKFPGQIISCSHDFQIDSFRQTSIDSAFCDIYTLSKCKSLIATYGSSFSGMAADLSGCDILYI